MLLYLLCFVLSVLAATSILMAWIYTELPVLFFNFVLKPLGYKKGSPFWNTILPDITTREKFIDAISWEALDRPHYLLADLLSCRFCLSFHLAFWCTLAFSFILSVNPLFAFIGAVTEPIIINILVKYAK